jgi:hypothetical protein
LIDRDGIGLYAFRGAGACKSSENIVSKQAAQKFVVKLFNLRKLNELEVRK